MSVKIRPARNGRGWQYEIRFVWPEDGTRFFERRDAPVTAKVAALRWAQTREAALLAGGKRVLRPKPPSNRPNVPTLSEFWPRVLSDYYEASRRKPSTIDAAKAIVRVHLAPGVGNTRLDAITTEVVDKLKGKLRTHSPKTVNNVLSVLSRILKCAKRWKLIKEVPCEFSLLPALPVERLWYEGGEYRRLVEAARDLGCPQLCLVLLGGSAGLRRGEIIALRWSDLDMFRLIIHVQRGMWRNHESTPKGGRGRKVPMTAELKDSLLALPRPGERVLYSVKGKVLSNRTVRNWLISAQKRAGLAPTGGIHTLRHTFCSHLAAAGVPAKAIQELAGHADLSTTLRYMHLSPSDRRGAIDALSEYYSSSGTIKEQG